MKNGIIRLTKKHVKPAGEVAGRALCDDPVSVYIEPDDERRRRLIKHVYQMLMCLGVKYGEVYAISPDLEGVSIWNYYKTFHKEKVWGMLICAIKGKIYKLGMQVAKKFDPIEDYNDQVHKELVPGEHWYLHILGVDPPNQGKGLGSTLVGYKLEQIDQQGLPAYVETSTERNVKFYEKLGFRVLKEGIIPETDVYQYYMFRDAK